VVSALRMEAAKDPDDPELPCSSASWRCKTRPLARWATHQVAGTSYGIKHYRRPVIGDLNLDCDTWNSPDGGGQRLMVLTAEPGTPSHERLRILASWTAPATQPEAPSAPDVPDPAPT
jgi:hypothetical protein